MEKRENILKELQEISPALVQVNSLNVLSVPPTYFTGLADDILFKIKEAEGKLKLPSANPYNVPGNYFDGLAGNILNKIKGQQSEVYTELEEIAPLLNSISKKQVYAVPTGYFETLKFEASKQQAKVVSFFNAKKVLRYAAAAMVAGIMAISSYVYFGNDSTPATVAPNMNVASAVDNLSEDEILSYLETNSGATDATINVADPALNLDDIIDGMPEEDIQEFLNEAGEKGDNS